MTPCTTYPSDLSDAQWKRIQDFFATRPAGMVGRPREHSYRAIVNAILYLLRTGCQWRQLPSDFPPYTTVSDYYHAWRKNGLLDRIHDALRFLVRKQAGKEAQPSAMLADSQSVKTTEKGDQPSLRRVSASIRANRSKAVSAIWS